MLFRKMLRDMKQNKTQFLSIFLMSVLAVFIYSGVTSEWYGLQQTVNQFYEDTNLADGWLYGNGFTKEAAEEVQKVNGVTGVERRLTLNSIAGFENKPTITLHFIDGYHISTFQLLEGEPFSLDKDGIWLNQLFAEAKGLKVGDEISLSVGNNTWKKEIKGLVMSPEYVYSAGEDELVPIRENYGYGFLSYQAFPKEMPIFYTELMITTDKSIDADLEKAIDKALKGKYSVFLTRDNMRSYMQFREEIKEHQAMGQIFPIAFLAVAMLTIITTMARLVNNQRTQIGILKAVGFKKRRILYHYVSYGLWISLAGAVIGTIAGPLTLPYMFYGALKTVFTLPKWQSAAPISAATMAVVSVIGCTLITYLTCRNVLKDTPAETLRPKAPKDVKHSIFDKLKIWSSLSFHTQWNLRDVFRCKGRSLMAIVGIIGCSALLCCAFGMQDTFDYIIEWNYGELNRFETKMLLKEDVTKEQAEKLIKDVQGEAILEGGVELKANDIKKSGELLVTDQVSLIQFVDPERNLIILPEDQISISYKMADLLKVEIGDQLSWHIHGEEKWNTSTIGAIYRTPFTQGITLSKKNYEEQGYTFTPTSIITSENVTSDMVSEGKNGLSKLQTKKMLTESYYSLTEAMNILIYVLMLAAVILAVVVIYNLGVLSYTERQRELSTLKVIGFKTKKLRTLLLKQNIWLTVAGIIPGIPIGMWMLQYIFQFVGEVFDFVILVSFSSYIYTILGTLLISALVNRLFSKKVKEIDMVSSLKGVE